MDSQNLEAASGPSHDINVVLPNKTNVLLQIDTCDIYGEDYTVRQSKENLFSHDDVKGHISDPNKFTLVLTKGKESIVMKDTTKTIEYLSKFTSGYTLEIRPN